MRKNTSCKLQLLDIFCGITAGFAYRRISVFASKNTKRDYCSPLTNQQGVNNVVKTAQNNVITVLLNA